MLLVVFHHVIYLSFGVETYTLVGSIFVKFRMPMFFFISGFIGYKAVERWTAAFYLQNLKKKAVVQLVPASIFFVIFSVAFGYPLSDFLVYGYRWYWFTIVLFEMFVIYFTLSLIGRRTSGKVTDWGLLIVAVLLFVLKSQCEDDVQSAAWQILALDRLMLFFQFFALGTFARKYHTQFTRIVDNDLWRAAFIVAFWGCVLLIQACDLEQGKLWLLLTHTARYAGVLMVFTLFRSAGPFFERGGIVARTMTFIGRRTLDIYLLHYFFLPDLSSWSLLIGQPHGALIELTMGLTIAALVTACSLLISRLIRCSAPLAHLLLGTPHLTK